MLHGNRVLDQTTSKVTLIIAIAVVILPHHQSTQLKVTLLDVTDYLFSVRYVVPLPILLEIPQKKTENLGKHGDKKYPPNQTYLANLLLLNDNMFECDVSNVYA